MEDEVGGEGLNGGHVEQRAEGDWNALKSKKEKRGLTRRERPTWLRNQNSL